MKKTLTNIVLAGSFVLGSIASDGCYNTDGYKSIFQPTVSQKYPVEKDEDKQYIPTLEDFKRVLGKERIGGVRNSELVEYLNKCSNNEKRILYMVYEPDLNLFYKSLSAEQRIFFENDFDPTNPRVIDSDTLTSYENTVPWRLIKEKGRYTDQDKALIWIFETIGNSIEFF